MEQYIIFGMGIILAILGFFLVKFYNSVEEIKKGVNSLMIESATRDQEIITVKELVEEVKDKQESHNRWLQKQEIEIAKLKK